MTLRAFPRFGKLVAGLLIVPFLNVGGVGKIADDYSQKSVVELIANSPRSTRNHRELIAPPSMRVSSRTIRPVHFKSAC